MPPCSPETQLLALAGVLQESITESADNNHREIANLCQEILKVEKFLEDQNDIRSKINENFVKSVIKMEAALKNSISSLKKNYEAEEKKLENKMKNVIEKVRNLLT